MLSILISDGMTLICYPDNFFFSVVFDNYNYLSFSCFPSNYTVSDPLCPCFFKLHTCSQNPCVHIHSISTGI